MQKRGREFSTDGLPCLGMTYSPVLFHIKCITICISESLKVSLNYFYGKNATMATDECLDQICNLQKIPVLFRL